MLDTAFRPLVTIGIPFYKDAQYLRFAIQSVINQTYTNWELILMDDGSTDGSLDIAKHFSDPRVRVISDGANKGLPSRLNEIVALANGDYVARMDGDDIMHPQRIEKQVEYMESHPDVNVLGTAAYVINDSNDIIGVTKPWLITPRRTEDIFIVGSFVHPSVMARKEWFVANPYDPSFRRMQDLELWIRTLPFSSFNSMKSPLLFYRAVEKNVTQKYLSTQKYSRGFYYNVLIKRRKDIYLGLKLYFKTYLKAFVYLLMSYMGKTDSLVKKRYNTLAPEDLMEANNSLKESIK